LTARELEVLRFVALGLSNKQIARKLRVEPGTIKKHLYNINGKLGVKSRTQAIAKARGLGMLTDQP
jgi:LuxR family maltose regulon positive regulatory protein